MSAVAAGTGTKTRLHATPVFLLLSKALEELAFVPAGCNFVAKLRLNEVDGGICCERKE